jgi:hypothetical protein
MPPLRFSTLERQTLDRSAMISKTAGVIGLNIHCIRATRYNYNIFSLLSYLFLNVALRCQILLEWHRCTCV